MNANLSALVSGIELTNYQRSLAISEFKKLEQKIYIEEAYNEMLIQELHSKNAEIDNLIYCLREMANYYLHEKEIDDSDLERLQERVIDLLQSPNSI